MSSGVARDCARVTPPKRCPRWVLGEILTRPLFCTVQQHLATVIYSNGSPFSRFVFSTVSCFSLQMVCVCVLSLHIRTLAMQNNFSYTDVLDRRRAIFMS